MDTSSLNFILDNGEYIFDNVSPSSLSGKRVIEDINAFHDIFHVGQRASWQLAVSHSTYREITATKDLIQKKYLENFFMEVWNNWVSVINENNDLPSFIEAEHTTIKLLSSGILDVLPDREDKVLLCEAIVYKCDAFCTRDWRTILKYRHQLSSLPIKIITAHQWWKLIMPYARLWV